MSRRIGAVLVVLVARRDAAASRRRTPPGSTAVVAAQRLAAPRARGPESRPGEFSVAQSRAALPRGAARALRGKANEFRAAPSGSGPRP